MSFMTVERFLWMALFFSIIYLFILSIQSLIDGELFGIIGLICSAVGVAVLIQNIDFLTGGTDE